MFGKVLYIDKKKLNDYMSIATGKNVATINSMQITNDKEIGVDISVLAAGIKGTKTYEANIVESSLYDIDKFENTLKGRDDYYNFTTSPDEFDLKTMNRGSIVKFDGNIIVPIEFDMTQMIGQFRPMLTADITANMEKHESEAFSSYFAMHNPKIPITCELSDCLLCSLIESDNLQISYPELEDWESTEVTILSRILSIMLIRASPFLTP